MANRGRIGQLPDDLIGNQGLPARVVSNERLEMLQQQIRRNTHVHSLRHHFGSSAWRSGDEVAYGGEKGKWGAPPSPEGPPRGPPAPGGPPAPSWPRGRGGGRRAPSPPETAK